MNKLPMPVICGCGYNTMDAEEAVKHARECLKDHEHRWSVMDEGDWFCSICGIGMSELGGGRSSCV